jgi:hypothetical protein
VGLAPQPSVTECGIPPGSTRALRSTQAVSWASSLALRAPLARVVSQGGPFPAGRGGPRRSPARRAACQRSPATGSGGRSCPSAGVPPVALRACKGACQGAHYPVLGRMGRAGLGGASGLTRPRGRRCGSDIHTGEQIHSSETPSVLTSYGVLRHMFNRRWPH